MTSDAFTYVYTRAMLKALELIENDIKEGRDPRMTWSASNRPPLTMEDLPEPMYCDPEYCDVDAPPGCIDFEQPTYGVSGVGFADPNERSNPYRSETQNWSVWVAEGDIWDGVGKQDEAVFRSRGDKGICAHPNRCGGIASTDKAGDTVVFRLPNMEVGLVVVCACCGKQVGTSMFMENPDVEISIDGTAVPKAEWELWPNNKCVRVRKRFPTSRSEKRADQAFLAVKVTNDMRGQLKISHVLTL